MRLKIKKLLNFYIAVGIEGCRARPATLSCPAQLLWRPKV